MSHDVGKVSAEPGLPCRRCRQPLDPSPDKLRTCAECGGSYHEDCVRGSNEGCAVPGCAQAQPSHRAWTLEARARGGVWLELPAPPRAAWLRWGLVGAAVLISAFPDAKEVTELVKALISAGQIEPWMAISVSVGLKLAPWAALVALVAIEQTTARGVLVDPDGVLFDHSPRWHGARLRWGDLAGFRLVEGGVRLVVHGRPWTRWLGPTIPADGAQQHDVAVLLEKKGVGRWDA